MTASPLVILIPNTRPLMTVSTAAAALDTTTAGVVELVDSGRIRFAWDLAIKGARSRCLRVLARCVADLQHDRNTLPEGEAAAWETVLRLILPHQRKRIPLRELASTFAASEKWALDVAHAGVIPAEVRDETRGPNSTFWFPVDRVAEFLRDRLL